MKNLNRIVSQVSSFLLVCATMMLLVTPIAVAQEGARVYLQPVSTSDSTLVADIITENVIDMYGAEIHLKYDPAIVAVEDVNANQDGIQVAPGTILPVDQGFVVANQVNEAEGTITFAMTLLNPAPPVSGSGPLARITFNVLQSGPSIIDIERAKLVAVDLQTIASQTESFSFGEVVQEAEAAPNPVPDEPPTASGGDNFPWWIVAAAIMVLGILALGGFILLGGVSTGSNSSINQQSITNGPPVRTARTRPSAFKN